MGMVCLSIARDSSSEVNAFYIEVYHQHGVSSWLISRKRQYQLRVFLEESSRKNPTRSLEQLLAMLSRQKRMHNFLFYITPYGNKRLLAIVEYNTSFIERFALCFVGNDADIATTNRHTNTSEDTRHQIPIPTYSEGKKYVLYYDIILSVL